MLVIEFVICQPLQSRLMYIKTTQMLAMIVIKIHLDLPGTMEVITPKEEAKVEHFFCNLKFCFLRSLSPDLQLLPHLSKMLFLQETLNLSPASLLPLNWEKLREALQLERS